jgi:hypothetical protein
MVFFKDGKPHFSKDLNNGKKKGSIAGGVRGRGYRTISVRVGAYKYGILAHRLNWFIHYGEDLPRQLDHIDQNKDNNDIKNLRAVTISENMLNRNKINKRCSSGAIGVHYNKKNKTWKAQCQYLRKFHYFGAFKTEIEAIAAREAGIISLGLSEFMPIKQSNDNGGF